MTPSKIQQLLPFLPPLGLQWSDCHSCQYALVLGMAMRGCLVLSRSCTPSSPISRPTSRPTRTGSTSNPLTPGAPSQALTGGGGQLVLGDESTH